MKENDPILSRAQRDTLAAAAESILPSNDGPGAAEARAVRFIEKVYLAGVCQEKAKRLRDGLDLLDSLGSIVTKRPFGLAVGTSGKGCCGSWSRSTTRSRGGSLKTWFTSCWRAFSAIQPTAAIIESWAGATSAIAPSRRRQIFA